MASFKNFFIQTKNKKQIKKNNKELTHVDNDDSIFPYTDEFICECGESTFVDYYSEKDEEDQAKQNIKCNSCRRVFF